MCLTRGSEGGGLSAWCRRMATAIAWCKGNTAKLVQTTWKTSAVVHGTSERGEEVMGGRVGGSGRVWGGRSSAL